MRPRPRQVGRGSRVIPNEGRGYGKPILNEPNGDHEPASSSRRSAPASLASWSSRQVTSSVDLLEIPAASNDWAWSLFTPRFLLAGGGVTARCAECAQLRAAYSDPPSGDADTRRGGLLRLQHPLPLSGLGARCSARGAGMRPMQLTPRAFGIAESAGCGGCPCAMLPRP